MTAVLQIVLGAVILLWGADRLTDSAIGIARRLGVSELVIGLTIVSCGTSMPEFFISLISAIEGTSDLAVGNVVGSNIFNTLFIMGCTAIVCQVPLLKSTVNKDMTFAILTSLLFFILCLDGGISRADAGVLILFLFVFLWISIKTRSAARPSAYGNGDSVCTEKKKSKVCLDTLLLLVGLACLIAGSRVFVKGATSVAASLGVSDAVIGLTIVACGTSLPELVTSIMAARKGSPALAIGNVLGSNVLNILLIIGVTALVTPLRISGVTATDLAVMLLSMLLLWLFARSKYLVERWEGAVLVVIFVVYMARLIYTA